MTTINIPLAIIGICAISYYVHILSVINDYWDAYKADGQIMIAYNSECINWVIFSTLCLCLFFLIAAVKD